MKLLFGMLSSYLIGSIPTAYLVGKWTREIDIRKHGSGNVGATNVFRVVGKKWGVGVLLFDMLKGVAVVLGIAPFAFSALNPFVTMLVCGISAIIGHTWTVWLGFRGGKGVATSAGVFLALAPRAALVSLFLWAVLFAWKRYVSLASLGTALLFPLWVACFYGRSDDFWILCPISLGVPVFIFYTHRENIRRLREGTEKRLV